MATAVIAGIGLVVSAAGQQQQMAAAKKTAKAQARQANAQIEFNKEQQKIAEARAARDRRNAFRQARASQANRVISAVNGGAFDSSSFLTASGSGQTNLGSNIGFANTLTTFGANANFFQQEIANQQVEIGNQGINAAKGQAISGIGSTIFSNSAAIGGFAGNLFSSGSVDGGGDAAANRSAMSGTV